MQKALEVSTDINALPADLLLLLLGRLGMRQLVIASGVSRGWKDASQSVLRVWAALAASQKTVGSEWRSGRPAADEGWYSRPLGDAPGALRWPCFIVTVPPLLQGDASTGEVAGDERNSAADELKSAAGGETPGDELKSAAGGDTPGDERNSAAGGDIIVSEHGNGRLSVFEPDSLRHVCCLGSEGGPLGGRFCRPTGVAISPEGELLVADCGSGRIARLDLLAHQGPSRRRLERLEGRGGSIRAPFGLAFSSDGSRLFLSDSRLHRIVEVAAKRTRGSNYTTGEGRTIRTWGWHGAEAGELDHPRGLTIHGNELIVADRGNNRLQCFDIGEGETSSEDRGEETIYSVLIPCTAALRLPSRIIGGEGQAPGRFRGPYDTAVARGRLFVSEFEGRRIQVLTLRGAPLQVLPLPGAPTGLCTSACSDALFVAEFDQHRLLRISLSAAPPPSDTEAGLETFVHEERGKRWEAV